MGKFWPIRGRFYLLMNSSGSVIVGELFINIVPPIICVLFFYMVLGTSKMHLSHLMA